jgi:UvrD-like helicase C-terminal domain/Nuclease-related domain/Uncharacterized conserved protein (DUF2075)
MRPPVVYHFRSRAESRVFDLLRESRFDEFAVALHSLNLPFHRYKEWAELDFVVVSRLAVLLLEVKGGGVECRDGIWYFKNRFGEEHRRSEGPFDQVRGAMFGLRRLLDDRGLGSLCRRFAWGWGVVFPDATCPLPGVEIPASTILDRAALDRNRTIDPYLIELSQYWAQRAHVTNTASEKDIETLVSALRPDFEVLPTLSQRLDLLIEQIVRLTDEQLLVLDSCEENPRILCQGPAGTGKTVLATELARRDAAAGVHVAFVCRRPELASFVTRRLSRKGVAIIHSTALKPDRSSQQFDRLIVDEAQDFLSEDGWNTLNALLRGGLQQGQWRMFMDANNQAGLEGPADLGILQRFRELGARLRLTRNCRNTREIVIQTTLFTGASLGEALIDGQGLKVDLATTSGEIQTADRLAERIRQWLEQDVRPGAITILSANEWQHSAARLLPSELSSSIAVVDEKVTSDWPPSMLTFSTIARFKGLENRCVALIDLDTFDGGPHSIAELYVAMTRANAALWIAVPIERKRLLDDLQAKNALLIARKGPRHV